jgi:hypothetical protein
MGQGQGAGELASEGSAARLRSLRRLAEEAGERGRVLCVRCRSPIPGGKRRDAIYCSIPCRRAYRWEQLDPLKREVRLAYRAMKAVTHCPCGQELDAAVRVGPVPRRCRPCMVRQAASASRERQRVARGLPAEPRPYRPWTPAEDARLGDLLRDGWGASRIAREVGRCVGSVRRRILIVRRRAG